jgi:hypothetical protein
MTKFIFLFALAASTFSLVASNVFKHTDKSDDDHLDDFRIVGGDIADPGDYPYFGKCLSVSTNDQPAQSNSSHTHLIPPLFASEQPTLADAAEV